MTSLVIISKIKNSTKTSSKKFILEERPFCGISLKIGQKCVWINTIYQHIPAIFLGYRKGFSNPSLLVCNPYNNKLEIKTPAGNFSFVALEWTEEYLKQKSALPLKDYLNHIDFSDDLIVWDSTK